MLKRSDLYEYQKRAVEFVKDNPRCAAWLDMGLGKSISSLTAISDLIDGFDASRILIVAPLRVARKTWPDEIEKWAHVNHLKYQVAIGSAAKRRKALKTPADVHLINVDNVSWLEDFFGKNRTIPYDMIVLDESSGYKNRGTDRFKAMRRMSRKTERLVELSATPSANSLLELWGQFYLLDGGKRLGTTYSGYQHRYFNPVDRDGYKWVPKKGAKEAIYRNVRDIVLSMKARDYLDLPDRVDRKVEVELSPEQYQLLKEFEQKYILELTEGTVVRAVNAAVLAGKMLQLANGQVYDEYREAHFIHDEKVEALRQLVLDNQGEPLLVAYSFQSDRDRLLQVFPFAETFGKNVDSTVDRWNRGEIPMLLVHPKSAGHGLNMQYGGRHVVWYGLPWSLELYLQLIGRLDRQGQMKPVIVHHIITKGTMDEASFRVLKHRDSSQEMFLRAFRDYVEDTGFGRVDITGQ